MYYDEKRIDILTKMKDYPIAFILDKDKSIATKIIEEFMVFIITTSKSKKQSPFRFEYFDINNLPAWKNFAVKNHNFYIINSLGELEEIQSEEQKQDIQSWFQEFFKTSSKYSDLQYDLSITAKIAHNLSKTHCHGDHMNTSNCQWYHSVWQYLRLFNMVSTPEWHSEYYIREISKVVKNKEEINALISGCADYSTYYFLCKGLLHPCNHHIDVLDMCETPLILTKQYALYKYNQEITTIQNHILKLNKTGYDLIVTDAFLTRFEGKELQNLFTKWNEALNIDGKVVTTLRYYDDNFKHGDPSEEELKSFVDKFHSRYKKWAPILDISEEELNLLVENYAKSMKSSNLGKLEDILHVAQNCGFAIELTEKIVVPGELYRSAYCRLVLRKEK